jgi:deoxycytidylate deaminase
MKTRRKLEGTELENALNRLKDAQKEALRSTCLRRRCGAVIYSNCSAQNYILGRGYNSPPGELETQRRCNTPKDSYNPKITDKTCCVHAEERAIVNCGMVSPRNGLLYFTSIDKEGNRIPSGKPYCTLCSKLALDVGIKEFIIEHDDGVYAYSTEYYNLISYIFE